MRQFWVLLVLTFLFFTCKKENPYQVDVSAIEVEFKINRFDQDFYESELDELPELKTKYPNFFPKNVGDSVWIQKKQNPDELELFSETQKLYRDLGDVTNSLKSLFKHVRYYIPEFTVPEVTTVLNNIDYDYRIIYNQKDLIISLDAYLGKEHQFYSDYPAYIKENNVKDAIVVDVATHIINTLMPVNQDRTFLGKMIFEGKRKFLLDLFLPNTSEKLKSGYSLEKLIWAKNNEEYVWKYFIDKDLLYNTDSDLDKRFIELAPFSKFYLQLDNESPGQIGVWIGWQIVRSFMDKNDVSLQSLLKISSEELFKKSRYKPRN